jgi:hypothetical protein
MPSPNHSACLSIAAGFNNTFSITEFIMRLLKSSEPSVLSTDDLLLIVQSAGTQAPYENRLQLRRRLVTSLNTFLQLSRIRAQTQSLAETNDPYGNLLMGFERKCRPVLESVMNRHGIPVAADEKLSKEDMRDSIMTHIAHGHCLKPVTMSRPCILQKMRIVRSRREIQFDVAEKSTCKDFVHSAMLDAQKDLTDNEIQIINLVLQKISSRKTLLRFLRCKNIPHDSSENIKHLRKTLKTYAEILECRSSHVSTTSHISDQWPSVVPQSLKDKILENFRLEISRQKHLSTDGNDSRDADRS